MIFYFSGTGNSRWVAMQLATMTGDKAVSITGIEEIPDLNGEKYLGLVFPIYAWAVPEPMLDFIGRLQEFNGFTYAVCTCGGEAGLAMKKLARIVPLKAAYSVSMPNNYIVGSEPDSGEIVHEKIEAAGTRLNGIAEEILAENENYMVEEGSMAFFKSSIASSGFNAFARSTGPFYADDRCTSCGICEKDCPAGTIYMSEGKPSWNKKCYQCLKCINGCPEEAIQYGSKTIGRKRYMIDLYLKDKQE